MNKNFFAVLICAAVLSICSAVGFAERQNGKLMLATTTSVQDTGLLDYLLPYFQKDTGIDVHVLAVGSGRALKYGYDGDVDVLLVHSKPDELIFMNNKKGTLRTEIMYNDFVIIGPAADPAGVKKNAPRDASKALALIAQSKQKFVSRSDGSGTHKKETALWEQSGAKPLGSWYISTGASMGRVVITANELNGYTLTDRSTYLFLTRNNDNRLVILCDGDKRLVNQYSVIVVNPANGPRIDEARARKFAEWIASPRAQKLIADFGKDRFGTSLYFPNAKK